MEGLRWSVVMPASFDPARERSMIVVLHGAGGTETGMAASLSHLAEEEFVVLAPKSAGPTWAKADLDAVRRAVASLKGRLRVGEGRLHAAGFSNGGWNLSPLAFDPELRFASACWIASGWKEGKPPPHAKKGMGVLALAGAEDGNRPAAERTPGLLEGKVRSAECLLEPGLGHAWPGKLMPYYRWWLLVQEGRFTPGDCAAFDWVPDAAAAAARRAERKAGGFVYFYAADQAGDAAAKAFQNETLRDPLVRRFGSQLAAWKAERGEAAEAFAKEGLTATPAVVVHDAAGKAVKAFQGPRISPAALAAALRSVAPDRSLPKD
jgi:dienelactone hydrolase